MTSIAAMIVLRRTEPGLPRPYRAPFHPWTAVAALVINAGLLVVFVIQDTWNSLIGFAIVAAIAAAYFVVAGKGTTPVAPIAGEPAE